MNSSRFFADKGFASKAKEFKYVIFRNGYSKRSPKIKVKYKGLTLKEYEGKLHFAILLGKVIWVKNGA